MEKHFKLTNETKVIVSGVTLFRIELTIDCKWGKKGDKGGWIEKESNISGNAWVYGNARGYGNARVYGNASVSGNAWVYGDARVFGNASVFGNARVYGNARFYGDARVYDDAWVFGDAWVYGDASVYGNARVYGDAWVYGNARVYGDAWEKSPLQIQGTKHFVNFCAKGKLKIGCYELDLDVWIKEFEYIGKKNGYSESEIKEYSLYIKLAKELIELENETQI